LCNPALPNQRAVESLLFDAFIPAAYRHDLGGRWKVQDVEKWLVFLAGHLERRIGRPDLAWWQLERAMPPIVAGIVAGIVTGIMTGIGIVLGGVLGFGTGIGLGVVIWAGVMLGVGTGIFGAGVGVGGAEAPAGGIRISAIGAGLGFVTGLASGFVIGVGLGLGVALGAGFGVAAGVLVAILTGGEVVPGDLAEAMSPRAVLARDRRAALLLMLAGGLGGGLAFGFATGVFGDEDGVAAGLGADQRM